MWNYVGLMKNVMERRQKEGADYARTNSSSRNGKKIKGSHPGKYKMHGKG